MGSDIAEDPQQIFSGSTSCLSSSYSRLCNHQLPEQPANFVYSRTRPNCRFTIASLGLMALYKITNSIHPRITKSYQELGAQTRHNFEYFTSLIFIFSLWRVVSYSLGIACVLVAAGSMFVAKLSLSRLNYLVILHCLFLVFLSIVIYFTLAATPLTLTERPFTNCLAIRILGAMTDSHQRCSENVWYDLQSHSQAGLFPLQACSTAPVTETGAPKCLVETPFSAAAHYHIFVVCPSNVFLISTELINW